MQNIYIIINYGIPEISGIYKYYNRGRRILKDFYNVKLPAYYEGYKNDDITKLISPDINMDISHKDDPMKYLEDYVAACNSVIAEYKEQLDKIKDFFNNKKYSDKDALIDIMCDMRNSAFRYSIANHDDIDMYRISNIIDGYGYYMEKGIARLNNAMILGKSSTDAEKQACIILTILDKNITARNQMLTGTAPATKKFTCDNYDERKSYLNSIVFTWDEKYHQEFLQKLYDNSSDEAKALIKKSYRHSR